MMTNGIDMLVIIVMLLLLLLLLLLVLVRMMLVPRLAHRSCRYRHVVERQERHVPCLTVCGPLVG